MKTKRIRIYETLRKPTTAALLLVYLACMVLACRFLKFGTRGIDALYMYVRYFYFPSTILTVLAYLSGITSFRSRTDEVLSAKKYPGYYQNRTFLFILGYALFLLASLLVVLLRLSVSNDVSDYFLGYVGKSSGAAPPDLPGSGLSDRPNGQPDRLCGAADALSAADQPGVHQPGLVHQACYPGGSDVGGGAPPLPHLL